MTNMESDHEGLLSLNLLTAILQNQSAHQRSTANDSSNTSDSDCVGDCTVANEMEFVRDLQLFYSSTVITLGLLGSAFSTCIYFRSGKSHRKATDKATLRPRQNGRHFADDVFKCIFLNENVWIPVKNSLKYVPNGPINNIPALVQIMAWRRSGDKSLSEPMMVGLPTHICVTRPQWVNAHQLLSTTKMRAANLSPWHMYTFATQTPSFGS